MELISTCCFGWNQIHSIWWKAACSLKLQRRPDDPKFLTPLQDYGTGSSMAGLGTWMESERVVVDGGREEVREEEVRAGEEASQAAEAGVGRQYWDSGERVMETWGSLWSVLYQSQCYEEGHSGMEEEDVVGFRPENMHLFFVCLFVCPKKIVTGIVWYLKRNIQDFIILWGALLSTGSGKRQPSWLSPSDIT